MTSLIFLSVIGALIGWVTNYLAVKMLFHPRKPLNLGLFYLQGIFPKKQAAFASKLGHVVAGELFSIDDVKNVLTQSLKSEKFNQVLDQRLDHMITEKLPAAIPMLRMVLNPSLIQTAKTAIHSEMLPFLESLATELGDDLDSSLDVRKIIEEKVANFSSDKLEELLFAIMAQEFRFIELIGGVLGFAIGVLQWSFVAYEPQVTAFFSNLF